MRCFRFDKIVKRRQQQAWDGKRRYTEKKTNIEVKFMDIQHRMLSFHFSFFFEFIFLLMLLLPLPLVFIRICVVSVTIVVIYVCILLFLKHRKIIINITDKLLCLCRNNQKSHGITCMNCNGKWHAVVEYINSCPSIRYSVNSV